MRRIFFFVAFGFVLTGCFRAENPPDSEVKPDAGAKPMAVKKAAASKPFGSVKKNEIKEKETPKKEASDTAEVAKLKIPEPRKVDQTLVATVDSVKVSLENGSVGNLSFFRKTISGPRQLVAEDKLIIVVRIINADDRPVKYEPWHAMTPKPSSKVKLPSGSDEHGKTYAGWLSGSGSRPIGGVEKTTSIPAGKTITDIIAFDAPAWEAEEIDIVLPAANVGRREKTFAFKIGRRFFEDEGKRAADVLAKAKADEQKRLDEVESLRIAKILADEKTREAELEAKRPRITRANYAQISIGMTRDQVERILGPGRESFQIDNLTSVSYRGQGLFPPVISIVYRGNSDFSVVTSKSIFGD